MASPDFTDLPADRRRRSRLVRDYLGGFADRIRAVIDAVPRHFFMGDRGLAYLDTALPIGCGQTISQPYVVATMLAALDPQPGGSVLDIGSGSGYVAALLARLVAPDGIVYALERQRQLVERSRAAIAAAGKVTADGLAGAGAAPVILACGDGFAGLVEHAPFAGIHVGCAAVEPPPALFDQLAPGGRLVLPVGRPGQQVLLAYTRDEQGKLQRRHLLDVRFVPMVPGVEG